MDKDLKDCSKCGATLPIDCFDRRGGIDAHNKPRRRSWCKPCGKSYRDSRKSKISENRRQHYQNNKERVNTACKIYYEKNKVKIKKSRTNYYKANRDKCLEKQKKYNARLETKLRKRETNKQRQKFDIPYKLASNLRRRVLCAIKSNLKSGSAVRDLGCSVQEFKNYIEQQFKHGMNWGNYGQFGWHLDHIVPLSKFDLTNRKDFLKAAHFTNYQPLWWNENISKGAK